MECKLEIGTIKVSWFDDQQDNVLKSVTFPSVKKDEAKVFADSKKSPLTMTLISQTDNSYDWKVEENWKMKAGKFVFDKKIILALLFILLVMGIIYSYKIVKSKING